MKQPPEKHLEEEVERIRTLKKYQILDTPPDGSFDRITQLAAKLLHVPIAIITLVDTDRIWFKSLYGINLKQINRDPGLCSSAILSDDIYIVEDAVRDPRTLANPLVAGDFGLQFYAAVPIKVRGNYNLGTLCVLDKNPRSISEIEKMVLKNLAEILIDQIELRLEARKAVSRQNELLHIAAHDLKNPLTTIPIWSDLIKNENDNSENISKMCGKIKEASSKMFRVVNELLETARADSEACQLNMDKIDLSELIASVVSSYKILAANKDQTINFIGKTGIYIYGDKNKLTIIPENLISNAIKYSSNGSVIAIQVSSKTNIAMLEVQDEGCGFDKEEKLLLFKRFSKLNNQSPGEGSSAGLGLSIVKELAEAHHGSASAESKGKNCGATFTVEFPLLKKVFV